MSGQPIEEFTFVDESMLETTTSPRSDCSTLFDQSNLLPKLLRGLGAVIIMVSASIFLFQKWGMGNDIHRYLLLLGFTSLLTAGGFFCGLKLQESKGARTLLGLTIAVAPVNFTVLGGLLYSQFAIGGEFIALPSYATWIAPTAYSAVATVAGSLIVLAAICHISFLTLGRSRADLLTVSYFLSSLVLLLPIRHPNPVALMLVASIVGLAIVEFKDLRHETALRTFEGRLARAALWVPPAILIARTGYLYRSSTLFEAVVLLAVAMTGFLFLPMLTRQVHAQKILQGLSVIPAVVACFKLADLLVAVYALGHAWILPLCTLPAAALLFVVSLYCIGDGVGYRRLAVAMALAGVAANLFVFPGLGSSFTCLLTGVAVFAYGYVVEQKLIFFAGALGIVTGLGYHLKCALHYYSLFNWGSLAVTGVAIIISASLLERNPGQIREKIALFRNRVQSWPH